MAHNWERRTPLARTEQDEGELASPISYAQFQYLTLRVPLDYPGEALCYWISFCSERS